MLAEDRYQSSSSNSDHSSTDGDYDIDVEKFQLLKNRESEVENEIDSEDLEGSSPSPKKSGGSQFLIWTAINTLATIGIVRVSNA